MQEEVEHRAVTLMISAAKLTGRELKAAISKYLASRKAHKQNKAEVKPSGRQTVKQLVGQNQGVSNIEVTESNIKGFDRVARKYGVDYAIKKDKSGEVPRLFQGAGRGCAYRGIYRIQRQKGKEQG